MIPLARNSLLRRWTLGASALLALSLAASTMPDDYFHTGVIGDVARDRCLSRLPMPVLLRGQERFNIYCTPCHPGWKRARHDRRARLQAPAGDLHGAALKSRWAIILTSSATGMAPCRIMRRRSTPQDRWAIAAYIRALQLSQRRDAPGCAAGDECADPGRSLAADGIFAELP